LAPLPAGADDEHVQVSYDKGILEVVIDLKDKDRLSRRPRWALATA